MVKGGGPQIQQGCGFAGERGPRPFTAALFRRICQLARFVDTRIRIWQILPSKPYNRRNETGRGRED